MLKKIYTILFTVLCLNAMVSQECPIINDNGSFEDKIYVLGGEANIGITTGQIQNWYASHGTVDYVTADWNYYGIDGINSIAGHMCYGHRETHNHSEGMYTSAKIYGDDDLLYTLKLEYATVCDATNNGFLNIALNSNLTSDGHNNFQYPTAEAYPEVFQEIQAIDRMELMPSAVMVNGSYSKYEISFVPNNDYEQIWLFTEYQYEQEEFVNCGIMVDEVELTATTTALKGIRAEELSSGTFNLIPEFSKELNVVAYNWSVNHQNVGIEDMLNYDFSQDVYTVCLDIIDARGACGSTCTELDLTIKEDEGEETTCTYNTCLDAGGLPNIVSFEYLSDDGEHFVIDKNTDGFFFPYCHGSESMCSGGESELSLFVEDLNAYFNNMDLEVKISIGGSEDLFDSFCRSMGLSIESSSLVPKAVFIDDFASDQAFITTAEFKLDPSSCSTGVANKEEELDYALVQDEKPSREIFEVNPIVYGNQLVISDKVEFDENLISKVGIYSTSGNLVLSIDNYVPGDEIILDGLPLGMYAINIMNKKYQQAGFFFFGGL